MRRVKCAGTLRGAALMSLAYLLLLATLVCAQPVTITSNRIQVFVAESGVDAVHPPGRGTTGTLPFKTIQFAVDHAPVGAEVNVQAGSYSCGVVVRKQLRLVATGGPAVMDCKFKSRALTFVNVPASVEGFEFSNGLAEGAGCVMVTMQMDNYNETNTFAHNTFTNCSGHGHGPTAGALLITYEHSTGRSYLLTRLHFQNNYGRGDEVVGGGMAVLYPAATPRPKTPSCHKLLLISTLPEPYTTFEGAYTRVGNNIVDGRHVYTSARPAIGRTNWLVYCAEKQHWGLKQVDSKQFLSLGCDADFFSASTPAELPDQVTLWYRRDEQGTVEPTGKPVQFVCQDHGSLCTTLFVDRPPNAQASRVSGVFQKMSMLKSERPAFRRSISTTPSMSEQFLWYCNGTQEWIFSDHEPFSVADNKPSCTRGIASPATSLMHPVDVPYWKHWEGGQWRLVSRPSQKMTLTCAPVVPQCDMLQVINASPSWIPAGPYVHHTATWHSRPTFKHPTRNMFIWYCGSFGEWVISESDPATFKDSSEGCLRSFSSHSSQAHHPVHVFKWAMLQNMVWQTTHAASIKCVAGCPTFSLDPSHNFKNNPKALGGYHVMPNKYNGRPMYLKRTHHSRLAAEDPPVFLWYNTTKPIVKTSFKRRKTAKKDPDAVQDGSWVLTLNPPQLGGMTEKPLMKALSTHTHPMMATQWEAYHIQNETFTRVMPPSFYCATHQRCHRLSVSNAPKLHPDVSGVYVVAGTGFDGRPYFMQEDVPTVKAQLHPRIYYCAMFSQWVIGPAESLEDQKDCQAWVATVETSVFHPVEGVWDRYSADGKWNTFTTNMVIECDNSTPKGVVPTNLKQTASDIIQNCTFTDNSARGTGTSAGGLLIKYGATPLGSMHHGTISRISLHGNEAEAMQEAGVPSTAGGVAIVNQCSQQNTHVMQDINATANVGSAGAILAYNVAAQMTKLIFSDNTGLSLGGAMYVGNSANVSLASLNCRNNMAFLKGGCLAADARSALSLSKADIRRNVAKEGSIVYSSGAVDIVETVGDMEGFGLVSPFLSVSAVEITCRKGRATAATGGYTCIGEVLEHSQADLSTSTKPLIASQELSSGTLTGIGGTIVAGIVIFSVQLYIINRKRSNPGRRGLPRAGMPMPTQ